MGCGKGSFLRKLIENKEWNNVGIGFDPSYVGPDSEFDGRLKFEKQFFEYDCIDGFTTDAIVCRHVIEHIADPVKFLKTIRESLKSDKSKTKIFFETPTVDWIVLNQVFYDFFYEHCSYFTERSLATAFQTSGFDVKSVNTIFNGQYLFLEATPAPNNDNHIIKKPGVTTDLTNKYTEAESKIGEDWNKKIAELTASGKIAIWGAGAKGVTFANFIDPAKQLVDCVIDLNPKKQGKYIPGTGHQIVAPKDIPSRNISSAILMNPNYHKEILELLDKSGIQINLVI